MTSGYKSIPSKAVTASFISTNTFKHVADFANVFKAFIGTNWLAIPFAFKQSGMVLGLAGLVLIALITDHCCQLLIKCKTAAVKLTVDKMLKAEFVDVDVEDLLELRDQIERNMTYGDIGRIALGKVGFALVNSSLLVTQLLCCTGYFIFLGNTIASLFPTVNVKPHHFNGNSSIEGESDSVPKTTAPQFPLLLLIPLAPLIPLAFIRNVRKLGPISFLANVALLVAFMSIVSYMLSGLHFKFKEQTMVQWATFPVFFGQVTSAYEGIGTIIPIETSMAENRHRFPFYLHLTIVFLSLILGGFGILGYSVYGNSVAQIVTENMTPGILACVIKVLLCFAILFTYPLQLFPVIRMIESWLFPNPKEHVKAKSVLDRRSRDVLVPYDEEQVESISNDTESTNLLTSQTEVITAGRSKVRTWQKNALRTLLVISTAAIAVGLKDDFAYLTAITGAIGSSMLAFILPCSFHFVLFKQSIHPLVVLKDLIIILFGVIGGLVGLYVVIEQLVKPLSKNL